MILLQLVGCFEKNDSCTIFKFNGDSYFRSSPFAFRKHGFVFTRKPGICVSGWRFPGGAPRATHSQQTTPATGQSPSTHCPQHRTPLATGLSPIRTTRSPAHQLTRHKSLLPRTTSAYLHAPAPTN